MSKFPTVVIILLCSISTIYGQQTLNETILHDGETREYTVYIPASYQGTSEVPLLFNFHGGSGDIASQLSTSDMRPIADTAGVILVYPQALPDPNSGGSTLWTHKEPTEVDDIFFVEAMIDALAADYAIDEGRVYGCGYSNGGEFSFELACRLSHRIAAIGVVARSMYIETFNNCSPTHPIGIVSIHGTNDDYEGIEWQGITYYISLDEVNAYWSDFNNTDSDPILVELPNINATDGSTVEHYSWNNGDNCTAVEHYKVIGGGHDWPGTFGNMDIDASLEIWNYVSKYDRNGLIGCSTVGTNENLMEESEITVFPNPTSGFIDVHIDHLNSPMEYEVYSVFGQRVLNGQISGDNYRLDLSPLPNNLYFLTVGNRTFKVFKMEN